MTRKEREQAALRHACPACTAEAGMPCTSLAGGFDCVLKHPHAERTALVFPVWRKDDKAPDAGNPLRHPRAKALLLARDASPEVMRAALLALTDRDPLPVLTALADAIEAEEAMKSWREWSRERKEERPCEAEGCDNPAASCNCGNAHCPVHPHIY